MSDSSDKPINSRWCSRRELMYRIKELSWIFRGYSIEFNDWVYGVPYRDISNNYIIEFDERHLSDTAPVFHKVYQNSIGQMIGLSCLDGYIFDGDIIQYKGKKWHVFKDQRNPNGFYIQSGDEKEFLKHPRNYPWIDDARIIDNSFEKYLRKKGGNNANV